MSPSLFAGFALGFSLILAIGAQNAFVLRQGLRRQHVFWICLACAGSDAVLIGAGVLGFGSLAFHWPWFEPAMRYGGAGFLVWYGARNLYAAWTGGAALETEEGEAALALAPVLATVLMLTWLNPHVYLDTVMLIGSISTQFGQDRPAFAAGAVTSSFIFFFSLGYGARLLRPVFARPQAWRVLELGIGVVMWAIAISLLLG